MKSIGKQLIIWIIFLAMATIDLIAYHVDIKWFLAVEVVFIIAIIIHCSKGSANPDYYFERIGISKRKVRDSRYDYLRIIATLMVIVTHTVQIELSNGTISGKTSGFMYTVIYWVCLACNLIFVMLSGALLITYREEKLFDYYIKRFSTVVIPMVIYFCIYVWPSLLAPNGLNGAVVKTFFERIYQGNTLDAPHYWLLYVILSVYVVIPILRYAFKSMPYKAVTFFVCLSWMLMLINLFVPMKFAISTFLSGWVGVAIMGYWVSRPETKKYYRALMVMGVVAIAIGAHIIKSERDFLTLCCNCSPIMCSIALGVFAFIFSNKKIFEKGNVVVSILSKYSFSIVLIHWWTIHHLTRVWLGDLAARYYGIGMVASTLLTLVISLALVILIDNLIVVVAQECIWFVVKKTRKLTSEKENIK